MLSDDADDVAGFAARVLMLLDALLQLSRSPPADILHSLLEAETVQKDDRDNIPNQQQHLWGTLHVQEQWQVGSRDMSQECHL